MGDGRGTATRPHSRGAAGNARGHPPPQARKEVRSVAQRQGHRAALNSHRGSPHTKCQRWSAGPRHRYSARTRQGASAQCAARGERGPCHAPRPSRGQRARRAGALTEPCLSALPGPRRGVAACMWSTSPSTAERVQGGRQPRTHPAVCGEGRLSLPHGPARCLAGTLARLVGPETRVLPFRRQSTRSANLPPTHLLPSCPGHPASLNAPATKRSGKLHTQLPSLRPRAAPSARRVLLCAVTPKTRSQILPLSRWDTPSSRKPAYTASPPASGSLQDPTHASTLAVHVEPSESIPVTAGRMWTGLANTAQRSGPAESMGKGSLRPEQSPPWAPAALAGRPRCSEVAACGFHTPCA